MESLVVWVARYGAALLAALLVVAAFGLCAWVIGTEEDWPALWRALWIAVGAFIAVKGLHMASELLPPSRRDS